MLRAIALIGVSQCLTAATPLTSTTNHEGSPKEAEIRLHEELAELHAKMAQCLKSGTEAEICRDQLRKDCPIAQTEQCFPMTQAELERHQRTHRGQLGGVAGDNKDKKRPG